MLKNVSKLKNGINEDKKERILYKNLIKNIFSISLLSSLKTYFGDSDQIFS